MLRILMLGDVIGRPGRKALAHALPALMRERGVDLCVVNGENAAAGAGLTPATFAHLKGYGAHVVTTGNHLLDKDSILTVLGKDPTLVRPANFPPTVPGAGSCVVQTASGVSVGVAHAMGRVFMHGPMDCPFRALSAEVGKLRAKATVIVVDFHAEASSEKVAMGWHLDGKVAAVVGTHTHTQTADERILPGGTAHISDLGMCGPHDSVLGMKREAALTRLVTGLRARYVNAVGDVKLCGALITVDENTGLATAIERLRLNVPEASEGLDKFESGQD